MEKKYRKCIEACPSNDSISFNFNDWDFYVFSTSCVRIIFMVHNCMRP